MSGRLDSVQALGPGGDFETRLPEFKPRPVQQTLAQEVERCLSQGESLVAESGTGTGKTFAYLVPAVLSELKVIVSTYTKTLQDQLFQRDLPAVCEALERSPSVALLKGRGNYVCLHRLEMAGQEDAWLSKRNRAMVESVRSAVKRNPSGSGDIAEISALAEDSAAAAVVTSTSDNCLGGKCRFFNDCYVNKARHKALAAEILVVNHHLFCADLGLKVDGFAELLPGADAVIFDEAHQLPSVASVFLGVSVSGGQLIDLCQDLSAEEKREQSQVRDLLETAAQVQGEVEAFRGRLPKEEQKLSFEDAEEQCQIHSGVVALMERVSELADLLKLAAPAGEGLSRCWDRALQIADKLSNLCDNDGDSQIKWLEVTARSFRLHVTPKDIGRSLAHHLEGSGKSYIYTSATLSVQGGFDHFLDQVGAAGVSTLNLPSPFDYGSQSLLYVPQGMPLPASHDYTDRVVAEALPIIRAARGRTFFLFTSHRALRRAAKLLEEDGCHNLFVQGSLPRHLLLERFRNADNAVLLGSASFWQGVDVKGEALTCVLIDKLPFEPPSEPVLRARFAALEEQGKNPFMDYQLPNAVIALKQGIGRLIRDEFDRGVLAVFDPRLYSKSYGRVFLKSIPDIPTTRELADVTGFLSELEGE